MSARSIRRAARRALHERLSVPAAYYPDSDDSPPAHHLIDVRVHTKFEALGDLVGVSAHYAERQDTVPQMVFWLADLEAVQAPLPSRGAVVSIEPGEAYRIDHVLPVDDVTVTAQVTRMTATEAQEWPAPEDLESAS